MTLFVHVASLVASIVKPQADRIAAITEFQSWKSWITWAMWGRYWATCAEAEPNMSNDHGLF